MKKALIGVGIGCALLVVVVVVVLTAGAFWVKGKAEDAVAMGKQVEAQQEKLKELDEKYPFTPPPDDQPLTLTETRLKDYLAIRASVMPVFKRFEAQGKAFEQEHKGKKESIGAAFEAAGMVTGLVSEVRAKYAEQLEARKMSPTEFHHITGAIYSAHFGTGVARMQKGQREGLEKSIASLDEQLGKEGVSDEQRGALQTSRDALQEQLDALPDDDEVEPDLEVDEANAALLAKYKVEIEKEAHPALDVFFLDGAEPAFKDMGKRFEKRLKPKQQ